jgi:hypothetical protein
MRASWLELAAISNGSRKARSREPDAALDRAVTEAGVQSRVSAVHVAIAGPYDGPRSFVWFGRRLALSRTATGIRTDER